MNYRDYSGETHYGLTFLEPYQSTGRGVMWWLRCRCGDLDMGTPQNVRSGNKKSCGCRRRGAPGQAGFNELFGEYQRNARKVGRVFELTKEEFRTLTSSHCFYCGLAPSQVKVSGRRLSTAAGRENSAYTYNGIDRIDNGQGYTSHNCRPACKECNLAKGFRSESEFLAWLDRITEARACRLS